MPALGRRPTPAAASHQAVGVCNGFPKAGPELATLATCFGTHPEHRAVVTPPVQPRRCRAWPRHEGDDRAAYRLAGARPMSVTAQRDRSAIARLSATAPSPFRRYGDTAGAPFAQQETPGLGAGIVFGNVRSRPERARPRGRQTAPVLTGVAAGDLQPREPRCPRSAGRHIERGPHPGPCPRYGTTIADHG